MHSKKFSVLRLGAVGLILAVSLSARAEKSFGGFRFHSSVPTEQRHLLQKDLVFLSSYPFKSGSSPFTKLTAVKDTTGPLIHNWVINRSRLIVGESFHFDETTILDGGAYSFENSGVLPDQLATKFIQAEESDGKKLVIVMANIGGALYLVGKQAGHLAGINFDDRKVFFTSPRTGLLQVGPGLFGIDPKGKLGGKDAAPARLLRLSTLVHESRHSDGNGKTAGFLHQICPAGHTYEGSPACDVAANGPYSIDSAFIKTAISACDKFKDCTPERQEILRIIAIDSAGRVTGGKTNSARAEEINQEIKVLDALISAYESLVGLKSTAPDKKSEYQSEIKKLKKKKETLQQELAALEKSKKDKEPPMWNGHPEGKFELISLKDSQKTLKK